MSLVTALPAMARVFARYMPDYVTDLGHIFDQTDSDPTPDSVTLLQGQSAMGFLAPLSGVYDTDGAEGRSPTAGSGAHVTDEDTVKIVVWHGLYSQKKLGTLQRLARPYPYAIRAVLRQHNRLQVAGSDAIWRVRATRYDCGVMNYGGLDYFATQGVAIIAYDYQLTPGDD